MPSSTGAWIRRMLGRAPREGAALRVRAIRGAIAIPADDPAAIRQAVATLVSALEMRNALTPAQIISAIFTATPDITSMFPALAARGAGWGSVPMLCATEIAVPGSLPLCIRVLVHVELPANQVVQHVYLGAAASLRPDLRA